MVAGFLKKESANIGVMLQKFWQPKYFVIDMYTFELKYALTPQSKFTIIPLSYISDVNVEVSQKY